MTDGPENSVPPLPEDRSDPVDGRKKAPRLAGFRRAIALPPARIMNPEPVEDTGSGPTSEPAPDVESTVGTEPSAETGTSAAATGPPAQARTRLGNLTNGRLVRARVAGLLRDRRFLSTAVAAAALLAAGIPLVLMTGSASGDDPSRTLPAGMPADPIIPGFVPSSTEPGTPDAGVTTVASATDRPTAEAPSVVPTGNPVTGGPAPADRSPGRTTTAPRTSPTTAKGAAAPVPTTTKTATKGAAAVAGAGPDYDAITGLGCKRDGSQDYYTRGQNLSGWHTGGSGGFRSYGCSGKYESMPLNGTNAHTDNRYMVWWFDTTTVSTARCDLWIFIPQSSNAADTAGTAHFAVIPNKNSGGSLGTFSVDQAAKRNSWAYGGRWAMTGGKLAVKLLDRGSGRASAAAALVKCYR